KLRWPLLAPVKWLVLGGPTAGADMTFGFPRLMAHAAKARALAAGTVIGSGTVSNKEGSGPGRPAASGGIGYSCIAEQRTVETIVAGKPSTPFLRFGDRVRIEMLDDGGSSIFGAIEQTLRQTAASR